MIAELSKISCQSYVTLPQWISAAYDHHRRDRTNSPPNKTKTVLDSLWKKWLNVLNKDFMLDLTVLFGCLGVFKMIIAANKYAQGFFCPLVVFSSVRGGRSVHSPALMGTAGSSRGAEEPRHSPLAGALSGVNRNWSELHPISTSQTGMQHSLGPQRWQMRSKSCAPCKHDTQQWGKIHVGGEGQLPIWLGNTDTPCAKV